MHLEEDKETGGRQMKFKIPEKYKKFLSKILARDKLLLILLVGVLLVVINIPAKSSRESKKTDISDTSETECMSSTEYVNELQECLEKILSNTSGVGRTQVMITIKNTGESVLYVQKNSSVSLINETDSAGGSRITNEKTEDESVVYTSENGVAVPMVVNSIMPEIQGVIVIAEGANDAKIVSDITEATSALLGISVNKIKVLKMEV